MDRARTHGGAAGAVARDGVAAAQARRSPRRAVRPVARPTGAAQHRPARHRRRAGRRWPAGLARGGHRTRGLLGGLLRRLLAQRRAGLQGRRRVAAGRQGRAPRATTWTRRSSGIRWRTAPCRCACPCCGCWASQRSRLSAPRCCRRWRFSFFALAVVIEVVYCALRRVTWAKTILSGLMVGCGGLAGWTAVAPLRPAALTVFALLAFWELSRNMANDLADLRSGLLRRHPHRGHARSVRPYRRAPTSWPRRRCSLRWCSSPTTP